MLELKTNISVDFYDKKYILINAKQHDMNTRRLFVSCYNHGEPYAINSGEHAAYIRYRKPDEYSVFNFCDIDRHGNIIVELTEQMLAVDGMCCADLVIVNKSEAEVNPDTGEIINNIENASILSSMPIYIDVSETPIENSEVESSYEYSALNDTLTKCLASYENVVKKSKSWAVGGTDVRDGENTNNSKYWSTQSQSWAIGGTDERSGENTNNSKYWSEQSNDSADKSESYAVGGTGTRENEDVDNAEYYSQMSKSYAVGGTGTRDGEDSDNAQWYYNEMKDMFDGLNIVFIPKGTISFSELATKKETAVAGYVYNIRDDFTTDETFMEGSGVTYTAGVNVYYVIDDEGNGKWDCFGGASSPVADVNEVKNYLGIIDEIEIV